MTQPQDHIHNHNDTVKNNNLNTARDDHASSTCQHHTQPIELTDLTKPAGLTNLTDQVVHSDQALHSSHTDLAHHPDDTTSHDHNNAHCPSNEHSCGHDHQANPNTHHAKCIRRVPIFNHLEDEPLDEIASRARTVTYRKGEFLFRKHEKDDTLYIINQGKVRIYRLSDSGKEQLVRILNPGDFTGEWTLFHPGEVYNEYAEATSDTTVCMIRQHDVQQIVLEHPTVALRLLAEMSLRLEQSENQTAQVAIESTMSRLISYLIECVRRADSTNPARSASVTKSRSPSATAIATTSNPRSRTITLPMTKKDLASYLGTTPETISRKFRELEQQGLINLLPKRQVAINNIDDLQSFEE